ncbi:YusW family protein [Bacillus nitroreducens]
MKKLVQFTSILVILVFMAGCNNDDENVEDVPEDVPVEENKTNTQDDSNQTTESAFQFTHFDLDVEYPENKEYDVDYENETDGMEAEIRNDLDNNHVKGDQAFEILRPIFEEFDFDKNTSDEDVVSAVTNAFNLDKDFQKFELEVKFLDGTEKEYNVGK